MAAKDIDDVVVRRLQKRERRSQCPPLQPEPFPQRPERPATEPAAYPRDVWIVLEAARRVDCLEGWYTDKGALQNPSICHQGCLVTPASKALASASGNPGEMAGRSRVWFYPKDLQDFPPTRIWKWARRISRREAQSPPRKGSLGYIGPVCPNRLSNEIGLRQGGDKRVDPVGDKASVGLVQDQNPRARREKCQKTRRQHDLARPMTQSQTGQL